ncbi:hypothetical protein AB0H71_29375 [Nocardia sp. NPDC050697]|uniref:hypothetical protein n=1 Tax=Nocardia sp. NPDC050697 TaxID=3155158 RepID=UPI0033F9EAB2
MTRPSVRAWRGAAAAFAVAAAVTGGAATASAAPIPLEPYQPAVTESAPAPIGEEFTSTGSSTISSSVNAKIACLFQRTFSAMRLDC